MAWSTACISSLFLLARSCDPILFFRNFRHLFSLPRIQRHEDNLAIVRSEFNNPRHRKFLKGVPPHSLPGAITDEIFPKS